MAESITWRHTVPAGGYLVSEIVMLNGEHVIMVTAYEREGGSMPEPGCPGNFAPPFDSDQWSGHVDQGNLLFEVRPDIENPGSSLVEIQGGSPDDQGRFKTRRNIILPVEPGIEFVMSVEIMGSFDYGVPMGVLKFWSEDGVFIGDAQTPSIEPGEVGWTHCEKGGIVVPPGTFAAELECRVLSGLNGIVEFRNFCLKESTAPPVETLREAMIRAANLAQVIEFYPDAALQKAITAAGHVWPNSQEFDVMYGDDVRTWRGQRAEDPVTGQAYVYFCEVDDWENITVEEIP